ncbi:Stk1 family PASTA domain-containing Ser/Thr kinase [Streptomyces tanashiensis]
METRSRRSASSTPRRQGFEGAPLIEVPDVVEQSQERAEQSLKDKGFKVKVEQEESDEDPGTVLRQNPDGNTKAEQNSEVTITVAKKQLSELPSVKGRTYDQAVQQLNSLGFTNVTKEEVDNDQPAGTVVDQTPQGPSNQPKDVQITLKVSKGPQQTQVQLPTGLTGKKYKEVRDLLQSMGLTVVQQGSDKEDAMVLGTNPPEGSTVPSNQPITVMTMGGGGGGDNNNGNPGGGGFFD